MEKNENYNSLKKEKCLYWIILIIIIILGISIFILIEKIIFSVIILIAYFRILAILLQIILHLLLIRFIVLEVAFAGQNFLINRVSVVSVGKAQASSLLKHLLKIDSKNVDNNDINNAQKIINYFYEIFTLIKEKFGEFKYVEHIEFYEALTDLKNDIENFNYNTQNYKYSNEKVINILKDYIGTDYKCCNKRFIRNFLKNNLFYSLEQNQADLKNYFSSYEQDFFITKDKAKIDYTIFKSKESIYGNNKEKKLLIICSPNGACYQQFCKNIHLERYLNNNIDVLCWNYRGYGYSTGKANLNNIKEDILDLFNEIKQKGFYTRFGVQGISIGGMGCCYLASKVNEIELLISDRNFGNLDSIAKGLPFGRILYFLYQILFIDSSYNPTNYINANCYKILINDPQDTIVKDVGSLKTLTATELCKNNIIKVENINHNNNELISLNNCSYNLKKHENILELFLDEKEEVNKFIQSVIEISNFINEDNINNSNKNCPLINLYKQLSKNINNKYKNLKEEELQNTSGVYEYIRNNVSELFDKFYSAGDNLASILNKSSYQKKNFIINFFNNLIIYGTNEINNCKINLQKLFDTITNSITVFLESQELISFKELSIIKNIEIFYQGLLKIKENLQYTCIKTKANNIIYITDNDRYEKYLNSVRGYLLTIRCGHNGQLSFDEELIFKKLLNKNSFFNKNYIEEKKLENKVKIVENEESDLNNKKNLINTETLGSEDCPLDSSQEKILRENIEMKEISDDN